MSKKKATNKKASSKPTKGFEESLWDSANKLRGSVESSEYKHVVLSLFFLKFSSDKFEVRRQELIAEGKEKYIDMVEFYTMQNVFYLPEESRWSYIKKHAKQDDIALKIDTALSTVEKNNKSLAGALPDNYFSQLGLDGSKLSALIDTINNIDTQAKECHMSEEDLVGRVYEYFLGKFAASEGKGGGEFYTPKSVVALIAEMIEPYKGKIYDPCCGSGGMFVQSIKFINNHNGNQKDISIYGQEYTNTTYKLAKMNLAIRGISGNLGDIAGDTFFKDQHPDLKADFIMANPPFNQKQWRADTELTDDPRWAGYEVPPTGNANYAWIMHMISKLSENGTAGFVLANGSMSSNTSGEGKIRQKIIENDLVDCMIAMPGQLFYTTQIPVCLWFLTKNKKGDRSKGFRDRSGETLFIDARQMGTMISRINKELTKDDIEKIAATYHQWKSPLPQGEGKGEGKNGEGSKSKESKEKIKNIPRELITFARELRKNQTDAEKLLWQILRNRQIADAKFRRQHPVENYILDFYCHEKKLAIELDGSQHLSDEGMKKDKKRSGILEKKGIKVIRFNNDDVFKNTEGVVTEIYDALTPALSQGERGYEDTAGFCKSATLGDIKANDYVLTPGRYVGAAEIEDDGIPFEEKMKELTETLYAQMDESKKLDKEIKSNLAKLGF